MKNKKVYVVISGYHDYEGGGDNVRYVCGTLKRAKQLALGVAHDIEEHRVVIDKGGNKVLFKEEILNTTTEDGETKLLYEFYMERDDGGDTEYVGVESHPLR